ncbi:hypothetical protein IMZ48_05630, partial [Candidatus Bathyarchaeota archaeon]|nr:hypothetical protein [Candidatus Bathyarchaeota archaeon]
MGKTAVLAQGAKQLGDAPYTPAPPRANPGNNIFGIFRRLSTSAAGLGHGIRGTHGLVERKVLNVDSVRERCDISDLDEAKLRRVAFCVDVEIAPQPRYDDMPRLGRSKSNIQPDKNGAQTTSSETPNDAAPGEVTGPSSAPKDRGTDATRKKKDKKKKNEEERKARKEKKRKMAEANGTVPIEIRRAS